MTTLTATHTNELFICGRCNAALTLEHFYKSTKRGRDNYCKSCRTEVSQKTYVKKLAKGPKRRTYLVITEVEDQHLRLALIKHALEMVQASMERRRQKIHEAEYEQLDADTDTL